jgi:phage-related protein
MDEFIWTPDWSAQGNTKANVTRVQFGDGYMQRQRKGMNTLQKTWSLSFSARNDTEADAIISFLEQRVGVIAFTWTPPGQPQGKWICDNWSRTVIGYQVSNISLTFELVYEP